MRIRSLIAALALLVIIITIIVTSGIWIYNASVTTFTLQNDILSAQDTRDKIVRFHLANNSDVQAFAATNDTLFFNRYLRHTLSFQIYTSQLQVELPRIDPHYDQTPIQHEKEIFKIWQAQVANPIFQHKKKSIHQLLTIRDPQLSKMFLTEDAKIQNFLNDAISLAEQRRTQFLERIIFARITILMTSITLVIAIIWSSGRSERDRLLQTAESEEQRRVTEMLQQSLVPNTLPETAGVSLQAVYFPAALQNVVGGDWYEVIELTQGRLMFIIGDVAGHGLDAATIMNRARQSIVAAAIIENDPAKILERANLALTRHHGRMVTALCCILDVPSRHFLYAVAGHPPPIIVAPNTAAYMLPYGGSPLGVFPTLSLSSDSCILERGSTIYLFTDGLIENEKDLIQGELHLLKGAALAHTSAEPASSLYRHVITSGQPKDDVAILSIRLS